MIKKLLSKDANTIYEVINKAARTYRGIIPEDCYHEPYMSEQELRREIADMTFYGWSQGGKTVGVIGFQPIKDVPHQVLSAVIASIVVDVTEIEGKIDTSSSIPLWCFQSRFRAVFEADDALARNLLT